MGLFVYMMYHLYGNRLDQISGMFGGFYNRMYHLYETKRNKKEPGY